MRERNPFFPPTGVEYVASALAVHVPRVTVADMRNDPAFHTARQVGEFVRREGVDLVGVSASWHFGFDEALELVRGLDAGVFTVVGGDEATARVEEVLERCSNVDAVARGEGEETVIDLALGKPLDRIPGLSFRRDGRIVHNESRVPGPIAELPARDRRLRRVSYGMTPLGVHVLHGGFDTVLTSRGCPFTCKFCPMNRNPFGRKRDYDERTPESVLEELAGVSADVVYFADDNFCVKPRRVERLCDMLIEAGIRKRFVAQARVELARHPALLEKLVRAGVRMLLLGVESASDRTLAALDKGFTVAEVREHFRTFRRFDIYYHGYFMIGNVGETPAEMLAIPGFARELGLDSITYLRLLAPPYTPIREVVDATPGYRVGPDHTVRSDSLSESDLRRIRRRIRRGFYTPVQVARSVRKLVRTGFLRPTEIAALPFWLPKVLWRARRARRSSRGA